MDKDNKNIGHFISFELWKDALQLLNAHVNGQETNKHFKTASMIYYKMLGSSVKKLESPEYFNNYVANNFFYGLENEFAIYPYIVPKSGLGLRNYKFLSYPMRVLYDAVGLYILKLSDEFLKNYYRKNPNIRSFYGGGITYENDTLIVTKSNIYFSSYYRSFRNEVRKEINNSGEKRVFLRIDVQNYYDEISIPILLNQFEQNYKDSEKVRLKFDTITKEQIEFLFRFLANDSLGIPQSDNCLISSIVGYLYLIFGDLDIDSELSKDKEILERYKIIRYVDDIYISLKFKDSINFNAQKEYIESIGARISDLLFYNLGLRLNPKTRFFWLDDSTQLQDLESSLKKVSPQYYSGEESVEDETLENKLNNVFDEIKQLKKSNLEPETFRHELSNEILKEVFDKRIIQLLDTTENKDKIRQVFTDFDFNRVKEYPLPIIIIILKDEATSIAFKKYMLERKYISTKDVDLMMTYLCQIDFEDSEILKFIEQYAPMKKIVNRIIKPDLYDTHPGYYDLCEKQIEKLTPTKEIIEQIRSRVFNERTGSYSVALNHLLNELHGICYHLDSFTINSKDYDVNQVVKFLQTKGISHKVRIGVRKLFDRRNSNQISHPGTDNFFTWSVSKSEYMKYHKVVNDCLNALLI